MILITSKQWVQFEPLDTNQQASLHASKLRVSCSGLACPDLPWPTLACPALARPGLPCPTVPCPALQCCPALLCPGPPCPTLPFPGLARTGGLPCPSLPLPFSSPRSMEGRGCEDVLPPTFLLLTLSSQYPDRPPLGAILVIIMISIIYISNDDNST